MGATARSGECSGCTGFTTVFTRLEFLADYDARFVIVTNGPIDEALAYKKKVGNKMDWYSSSESSFGADVDAGPGEGFGLNVFLRDGDTVYRTWHTNGRGVEQLTYSFALTDVLPYGRQEEWQDSPTAGRSGRTTPPGAAPKHRTHLRRGWLGLRCSCDRDTRSSDPQLHPAEPHHSGIGSKLNWLRAGVLGANDGIVSTAGIVVGVAAATAERGPIFTAGIAGLAAGALSMAVGEYVSVSTQRDTEKALLRKERRELDTSRTPSSTSSPPSTRPRGCRRPPPAPSPGS